MKKIAVIILNYNDLINTRACLLSLEKSEKTKFTVETIVVDNASSVSPLILKREFPEITLIQNSTNFGFAEGNNTGIREALRRGADFVFILNNDTILDPKCLISLFDAYIKLPIPGILGPKIYFYPGREYHIDRYQKKEWGKIIWYAGGVIDWANVLPSHRGVDEVDKGQYDVLTKTQFISGCAMFAGQRLFEKVGLFDKRLYLYYEDLDLCKRAEKKGCGLWYVPEATVWHKNAGTTGGSGSDLQSYYMTRNRLLIGMRYAPWKSKLALFREASKMIVQGTKSQKQAIGDFLRRRYGKRKTN